MEKSLVVAFVIGFFKNKYNLYVNRRVHTRERRFLCSTCGKVFTTNGNLKNHRATHSDERIH